MLIAKILLCIFIIGGIGRINVPPEFESQRDFAIVLIVLYHIFLPFGNIYGLSLIITCIVFGLCILFQNIMYPQIRDNEIDKLSAEVSRMHLILYDYENHINDLEKELKSYRKEKSTEYSNTHLAIMSIYDIITQDKEYIDDMEKYELIIKYLEEIEGMYSKPIVQTRYIDIDLFDNLTNKRKKKWAIRYLESVRKDVNFGIGFDAELKNYIKILKKEVENDVRR